LPVLEHIDVVEAADAAKGNGLETFAHGPNLLVADESRERYGLKPSIEEKARPLRSY
jgi:hypothetical protein